jgi:hypothetical protein
MGSTLANFNERYQKVKTAAVDHRSDDLHFGDCFRVVGP